MNNAEMIQSVLDTTEIETAVHAFVQHGDAASFEFLHGIYKKKLWAFLCSRANCREDAEEIFNIVSMDVYKDLASLQEPQRLVRWVMGIASNRLGNYYQRKKRQQVNVDDFVEVLADPSISDEEQLAKKQLLIQLRKCIGKLPERQRGYVTRQFLEGASQKSIAESDGVKVNVLKANIFRAKTKLVACMREAGVL